MTTNRSPLPWLVLLALVALLYLYGLNSPFAPTNGDEMVYIHIARMTAESGHWLPLQSEIVDTRNTKPPLLFWQAMVAGDWGQHWNLFTLRLPSVAYTFATTALLGFFTLRISGRLRTACLAAVLYLLFFSTFRYGRAYLTSAPETFWLALPMWWLLWDHLRPAGASSPTGQGPERWGFITYTLFGLAMGLGCAYKSFALAAPTAAALWCAVLVCAPRRSWPLTLRTTLGVGWSTALAVGIFALWFVLDPDPASVWQEFVLAENAGKLSNTQGYWHNALFGTYPMWIQLLAYPSNAGLLAFPVFGLAWVGLRTAWRRSGAPALAPATLLLLVWLAVWLVVFTVPSQRSERYLIPAMPAIAMLMALSWERLGRVWFWLSLALVAPALVMIGRIAWVMADLGITPTAQLAITLVAVCAGLAGACIGFVHKAWSRNATLVAVAALYAGFGLMVQPLSTDDAGYGNAVQAQLQGKSVAVPNGFTGQYERFHFLLPAARITPFDAEGRNTGALRPDLPGIERLTYLLARFDAVVWLQDRLDQAQPSCLPSCTVLATRWHIKSRHKEGEITGANLWYPEQWLFRREWLVAPVAPH
jgi:4-amino-4-deoxy-L-arabinose transferase-like glycosyltransferase